MNIAKEMSKQAAERGRLCNELVQYRVLKRKRVTKADLLAKIARMEAFARLPIVAVRPLHQESVRGLRGFVAAECYGDVSPMQTELGRTHNCRFVCEQLPTWKPSDAGAITAVRHLVSAHALPVVFCKETKA